MPQTTQCPGCGVVLNLPDGATGRRLRCPKCNHRFVVGGGPAAPAPPSAPASPRESAIRDAGSTLLLSSFHGDSPIPTAEGDLRETFDLSSMTGEDTGAGPRAPATADVSGLFRNPTASGRRPAPAEARAQARRCPTCGAVVPAGMSLCTTCGLNLETGAHVGLDDDLGAAPPAPRGAEMPIGIGVVGGLSMLGAVILAIVSLVHYVRGHEGSTGYGLLGLVCLFGIYASAQFLRGKSVKLLVIALSLGAVIAAIALIAVPLATPILEPPQMKVGEGDIEGVPAITPLVERIDFTRITWGIAALLGYAAVVVYLASPPVRRHFARHR